VISSAGAAHSASGRVTLALDPFNHGTLSSTAGLISEPHRARSLAAFAQAAGSARSQASQTAQRPNGSHVLHHKEPAAHLPGVTVSMRVMSAGDGYRYLLASVAAGDGRRSLTQPLIDYYTQTGTPPGYWLGTGTAGLGNSENVITPGGIVHEEHLQRLLGQGHDPVTDQPLGLAYRRHKTVQERIAARIGQLDPQMAPAERAAAVEQIETQELASDTRRVVAGYDYTFSVHKSVSTLWAVADAGTRARIVQAHHAAIADVVALMEREVAATRVGHNGVAQVATRGLIATCYDHYDSRAGDPQLHTHVVIANKVQGPDGKWRTLDGRPMHAAVVAISEHYNALLADRLSRDLSVAWEQRARGSDRNPAWEITGVPDQLLRKFSSRSTAIDIEKDRLIAAYTATHGHQPTTTTILRLRAQATLSTRPQKTLRSLQQMTSQWHQQADSVLGRDASTWATQLLAAGEHPPVLRAGEITPDRLTDLGRVVVEQVQAKRCTWSWWNLHAEASRQTMNLRFATTADRETLVELVAQAAQQTSVRITPPELSTAPAAFTRPDGSSMFRPHHAALYTSKALLAAEQRLLDLARTHTGPAVPRPLVARLARHHDQHGRRLSREQQHVVQQIAGSGRTLDLLVGPAGAGKTVALGALRRAWETRYGPGSVIGLAPSAAAAEVLASELGIPTENTAKWVHEHHHHRYKLTAGQLVILDEASLAGTMTLDLLATHAAQVDAKVLLAGDWAQLAAIDAGGAFGMLIRDRNNQPDGNPAPELTDIHRFTNTWEKDASLRLRHGDPDVIDLYQQHGRIIEGEHDQILNAAYRAWQTDTAAGSTSILIAETSETVTALNQRARADRVLAGQVSPSGIGLHDSTIAGQGDTIITRRNDRHLATGRGWVKNGDRWTVLHAHNDGSLTIQRHGAHGHQATTTLPASYVAEHVELGYAITAHRAQGTTVDTAHLLIHSSSITREALYVSMTRGRHANHAYLATDETHLEAHQHTPDFQHGQVTARSILTAVLQHQGAERSAHETIAAQQNTWTSIAQLAAEYETIAQAAQQQRFAIMITNSSLHPQQAKTITDSESFGALIAQLRRIEADGHQPEQALSRAIHHGGLENARDPAAVIQARLAKLAERTSNTRPRNRPRYIAGLIPQAGGPMPADIRRTLDELSDLIEQRATTLANQALESHEPWVHRLGQPPADPMRRSAWQSQIRTIVAYRDRYEITCSNPLGPPPSTQGQRLDHQRAALAARAVASQGVACPHPPTRPIGTQRELRL
jgi:conjugative relaxase-like TrwC/TraI family protein